MAIKFIAVESKSKLPERTLHFNGEVYPWRVVYDNGTKVADADSANEVINALIKGYNNLGKNDSFLARREYQHEIQRKLQTRNAKALTEKDLSELSDEETQLLTEPDTYTDVLYDSKTESSPYVWTSNHPLVLVDADHVVSNQHQRPVVEGDGKITWLCAFTEVEFLQSLHDAKVIKLDVFQPDTGE